MSKNKLGCFILTERKFYLFNLFINLFIWIMKLLRGK